MSSSNLVRTGGGLASATAGTLLLVGHLLNLGGDLEYGTVLGESLVLAAHLLLVFGLVALYAAQAEESGSLGALGMVVSVLGTTLASGVISGRRSPAPRSCGWAWLCCRGGVQRRTDGGDQPPGL